MEWENEKRLEMTTNIRVMRLCTIVIALTATVWVHPLYAQEEEEEEGIIWGEEEEGFDEDFFGEDDEFFDEGEESFDDEFGLEDEFGDEMDEFLEEDELLEEEFVEEEFDEEPVDFGYNVRLSAASPSFVNNTLMTWNSFLDVRLGADLPFTFSLGPIRMRLGAEVVTYKFENYLPEGGTFNGVGIYGMVTFPAGPSDMHVGVGVLGSSPAVVLGQSFGIPYTDNIILKLGTRVTMAANPPEQIKEIGPAASWLEGFFTVVYSLE